MSVCLSSLLSLCLLYLSSSLAVGLLSVFSVFLLSWHIIASLWGLQLPEFHGASVLSQQCGLQPEDCGFCSSSFLAVRLVCMLNAVSSLLSRTLQLSSERRRRRQKRKRREGCECNTGANQSEQPRKRGHICESVWFHLQTELWMLKLSSSPELLEMVEWHSWCGFVVCSRCDESGFMCSETFCCQ